MSADDSLTAIVASLGAGPGTQSSNPPGAAQSRTIANKKTPCLSTVASKAQARGKNANPESSEDDDKGQEGDVITDLLRETKAGTARAEEKKSKKQLLKEMLIAQTAGNTEEVKRIMNILAEESESDQVAATVAVTPKRARDPTEDEDDFQEGGVTFMVQGVNTFLGLGLPPFFDRNMKELKGEPSIRF
ncbi:hypothetical protein PtA15_4A144 [Puccinia triticina]|uniref:Nascent polypeptide-associated complex subunit alpha-like UBA domain-containing protein n=1 Tax=Puccinia triticina TaxID=208348 RepID=A0ABY7CHT5_9BASI|nr:uncharacterized protein PtA15_4A144 [Puccinia triticina]WAQ83696.1 hypothetical protein PtA15_4A144 [Puccinia triticina]